MRPIRNSAKAVIVQDGRILLIQLKDEEGAWYALPAHRLYPKTLIPLLSAQKSEAGPIYLGDVN